MAVYIQNEDNYVASLQNTEKECFGNYIKIINDYIKDFNEKIVYQNNAKHTFILEKGFDTIRHVFTQFLLYSNNLEFAIEVTEKAYQYFIEFIGQIGEENNAIFNLSTQDAILFAYKKTIYEIPPNIKKDFSEHDPLIDCVKGYVNIYDVLLIYHINHHHTLDNIDIFLPITDSLLQLPLLFDKLDVILSFIKFIQIKNIPSVKYFQTINIFVKQIGKKGVSLHNLEKKFINSQTDIVIESSPHKIVKWFLS